MTPMIAFLVSGAMAIQKEYPVLLSETPDYFKPVAPVEAESDELKADSLMGTDELNWPYRGDES